MSNYRITHPWRATAGGEYTHCADTSFVTYSPVQGVSLLWIRSSINLHYAFKVCVRCCVCAPWRHLSIVQSASSLICLQRASQVCILCVHLRSLVVSICNRRMGGGGAVGRTRRGLSYCLLLIGQLNTNVPKQACHHCSRLKIFVLCRLTWNDCIGSISLAAFDNSQQTH